MPLTDAGLFQVQLTLTPEEYQKVFPDVSQPVYVSFTDLTHAAAQAIGRQQVMMMPYAGKVPVDGKTLRFGADGKLTAAPERRANPGEFLTTDGSGKFMWAKPSLASSTDGTAVSPPAASLPNTQGADLVLSAGNGTGSGGSGEVIFKTAAPSPGGGAIQNALEPRMTITQDGNVGIGTTSPGEALEVAGLVRARGFATSAMPLGSTPVYIRGGAFPWGAQRTIVVGDNVVHYGGFRGLMLVVIDARTQTVLSKQNYDTWGSSTDADNLAKALNDLTADKIGILASHDAIEAGITQNLRSAALRLGLTKLAGISTAYWHPYAAIFRGAGAAASFGVAGRQAVEVVEPAQNPSQWSQSSLLPSLSAVVTTWLTEDGFHGQSLTNALVSGEPGQPPAVFVNASGNVGIGTTSPGAHLEVNAAGAEIRVANQSATSYAQIKANTTNQLLINKVTTVSGGALIDLNPSPIDAVPSTQPASVRLFRNTNTTGAVGLSIMKGDNSTSTNAFISGNGNSYLAAITGNVGIGTTIPTSLLELSATSDAGIASGLRLRNTANSIGSSTQIDFRMGSTTRAALGATVGDASGAGHLLFSTLHASSGLTEKMRIDQNGNVGIGTSAPSYLLHVNGSVAGVGAYNQLSDARYKKDVHGLEESLTKVLAMRGVSYKWLDEDRYGGRTQIGVIAQELEAILPDAVETGADGVKRVKYTDLIPVLVEAVKQIYTEKNAEIAEIRAGAARVKAETDAEVSRLRTATTELEAELEQIKEILCASSPHASFCR